MTEILILVVIAVIVAASFLRRGTFVPPATKPSDAGVHKSYRAADSLFVNRSELAFFHALSRALPNGYFVQSKVRLEDILGVGPQIKDARKRWALRGRVKSRHLDFLIIDDQGCPCIAIELDGSVHNTRETDNADALKDGLFKACDVPFVRVRTGEDFHVRAQEIAGRL